MAIFGDCADFMTSLQQIGRPNLHAVLRPRGASHEVLFATPAAVFRRFQELFQVCQTQMPISFETEAKSRVNSSHTWFILSWPFPLPFVSFLANLRFVAVLRLHSLSPASCSVAVCPSIPHTVRLWEERFVSEGSCTASTRQHKPCQANLPASKMPFLLGPASTLLIVLRLKWLKNLGSDDVIGGFLWWCAFQPCVPISDLWEDVFSDVLQPFCWSVCVVWTASSHATAGCKPRDFHVRGRSLHVRQQIQKLRKAHQIWGKMLTNHCHTMLECWPILLAKKILRRIWSLRHWNL